LTLRDDTLLAKALARARSERRPCALATVVGTRGSTPRKVGARMLVEPGRGLVGTIGGGCGEAEVIEVAHRVVASGRPERVRVDLTEEILSWSPAVCGGVMDVFVEALEPEPRVRIHYRRLPDREDVFDQVVLEARPDVVVTYAPSAPVSGPLRVDGRVILEPGSPVVWFTFPGAWHDIGRFHRADGRYTGCYANVLTPPEMGNGVWSTTDLFLDVWVPAERGPARILDVDELEDALALDQIDAATARRAREEARTLKASADAGRWPPPIVDRWTLRAAHERLGAHDPGAGGATGGSYPSSR